MVPLSYFLIFAALLFSVGIFLIIINKNAIVVLMGVELMLNAANINLVSFGKMDPELLQGQMFAIFVIVVAVSEMAVAFAILIQLYNYYKTVELDKVNNLKG